MANLIQFDLFSEKKPFHQFLDSEMPKILSMNERELVVIGQLLIPGIGLGDVKSPIYIMYQKEDYIRDLDRAINFIEHLTRINQHYEFIGSKEFCETMGLVFNEYIISFHYLIINKILFDQFIQGKTKNPFLDENKVLLDNAYAEFLISKNFAKKLDTNSNFKLEIPCDITTKLDVFNYCIKKYKFSRFMKSKITESMGDIKFLDLYL